VEGGSGDLGSVFPAATQGGGTRPLLSTSTLRLHDKERYQSGSAFIQRGRVHTIYSGNSPDSTP
jgi:hypothetical protein